MPNMYHLIWNDHRVCLGAHPDYSLSAVQSQLLMVHVHLSGAMQHTLVVFDPYQSR